MHQTVVSPQTAGNCASFQFFLFDMGLFVFAAVAAAAPRKSLGSSSANSSSSSSSSSTPGQSWSDLRPKPHIQTLHDVTEAELSDSQRRANTPVGTRCAPVPPRPGRKASGTSLAGPPGNQRRRTRSPKRLRTMKRPGAVECRRPAGSMFAALTFSKVQQVSELFVRFL